MTQDLLYDLLNIQIYNDVNNSGVNLYFTRTKGVSLTTITHKDFYGSESARSMTPGFCHPAANWTPSFTMLQC